MPTYHVEAVYKILCSVDIDAADEDEAEGMAGEVLDQVSLNEGEQIDCSITVELVEDKGQPKCSPDDVASARRVRAKAMEWIGLSE